MYKATSAKNVPPMRISASHFIRAKAYARIDSRPASEVESLICFIDKSCTSDTDQIRYLDCI